MDQCGVYQSSVLILYCKTWGAGDGRASHKFGGSEKETERKVDNKLLQALPDLKRLSKLGGDISIWWA